MRDPSSDALVRELNADLVTGRLFHLASPEHGALIQSAVSACQGGRVVDAARTFITVHHNSGIPRFLMCVEALALYAVMEGDPWAGAAIFGLLFRYTAEPVYEAKRQQVIQEHQLAARPSAAPPPRGRAMAPALAPAPAARGPEVPSPRGSARGGGNTLGLPPVLVPGRARPGREPERNDRTPLPQMGVRRPAPETFTRALDYGDVTPPYGTHLSAFHEPMMPRVQSGYGPPPGGRAPGLPPPGLGAPPAGLGATHGFGGYPAAASQMAPSGPRFTPPSYAPPAGPAPTYAQPHGYAAAVVGMESDRGAPTPLPSIYAAPQVRAPTPPPTSFAPLASESWAASGVRDPLPPPPAHRVTEATRPPPPPAGYAPRPAPSRAPAPPPLGASSVGGPSMTAPPPPAPVRQGPDRGPALSAPPPAPLRQAPERSPSSSLAGGAFRSAGLAPRPLPASAVHTTALDAAAAGFEEGVYDLPGSSRSPVAPLHVGAPRAASVDIPLAPEVELGDDFPLMEAPVEHAGFEPAPGRRPEPASVRHEPASLESEPPRHERQAPPPRSAPPPAPRWTELLSAPPEVRHPWDHQVVVEEAEPLPPGLPPLPDVFGTADNGAGYLDPDALGRRRS